ncbi:hypothetical protein PG995_000001 [Apiospora arundinis]
MLAHDANFEWHVLEQFDLKPWLDSVGVDVVDIQSWPIWVKHVQHSSGNFQNQQPGAAKVLAGVNVVSEWVHPETKQVYHLAHNSGNDAHHLILSYLRTVFMPSEFTPSFEIGLPIPDEHRLQPKINKAGLLRNIARYGEDPKSDPPAQPAPAPLPRPRTPPHKRKRADAAGSSGSSKLPRIS